MISARTILVAMGALVLCLDAYAIRKVFKSTSYEPAQRYLQAALIVCAPLVGAWLALYMARESVPMFQKPPVDHVGDITPETSNFDLHG